MHLLPAIIRGWENLIIFTAYYFSTPTLVNTFLSPWHRYSWKKQKRGLHLDEEFFVLASNILSRFIGILLRIPVISLGVIAISSAMIIGLPIALVLALMNPNASIFDIRKLLISRPLFFDWHYGYTPELDKYSVELYNRHLPLHLIGRENEISQIRRTLHQQVEKNILVVGDPGSGRHALLSYLARFEPTKRFMLFNFVTLLKNAATPQEQAGTLEEILRESENAGNIVLIVDSIERLLPFENVLTRYLESKELTIIGVTTSDSYHKQLLPDESLMKFFFTVEITELDRDKVLAIVTDKLTSFYRVKLPSSLVQKLFENSYQLQTMERKHQPEAALHLTDEFVAYLQHAIKRNRHANASHLLETFLQLRLKIPTGAVQTDEKELLTNLEQHLQKRVIAQPEAMSAIANAIRRRRVDVGNRTKPIGSFLLLGPTGVGKTDTAKALADIFFHDRKKLTRFDMARYQQKEQITSLQDELAKAIRQNPYCVLLVDEIEKAHPDLLNLFLTVVDEGYFQDTNNATIACNNIILIGTSNAAAEYIREQFPSSNELIEYVLKHGLLTPELVNRFDAVVVYQPLSIETAKQIARLKLEQLKTRLAKEHHYNLEITNELINNIVAEGTHPEFGAREIDRTIQKLVENPIAAELLNSNEK